jgi:hypothetical protein
MLRGTLPRLVRPQLETQEETGVYATLFVVVQPDSKPRGDSVYTTCSSSVSLP